MALPDTHVELPAGSRHPLRTIGERLALALGLVVLVALLAYIGRDGYIDPEDGGVSLLDAFYYSTVTITTTGYGDIRPVSDGARLVTTIVITPARILFLILLVGTTLEVLTERTRDAYRLSRWRKTLKDHVIICGFGTKGRAAAAVLATLTARELNPGANLVGAVREDENAHLLHESGANSVITSSSSAGRLLGLATTTPEVAQVLEDLLSVGAGLDIVQRPVGEAEVGPLAELRLRNPVVAVSRGGRLLRFDDPDAAQLEPGDALVEVVSRE